ncbi:MULTISPECIES: cysteine/glutathione ABC transporter permease/ATP-binding protein CydD [unclassified Tatumella]|uniref:heme ABC transporter permease/ATP-binding protein CydD n=1 Tax=unclassified Tatumella TaxID=2649542 RepID=UPI001BAEDF2D|nr:MULTISPECIES: cysteine/glutathione ABC transporter permease/ATP-binding protein CydD [unclassified Tatumella]MBS0875976.1 cysteine/glutathione ABC transporter permease/ATP-binding protein CydD [Tatumella sp. JGM82]MBS0890381.1 cysteine/glutathione ABC transporter permease/ATP-binding protein CydD [Tatumella sp. JGM94]MBS0900507.1 cysteine/glutathione ABC transporter permease/ATP-binding protein CydD [Tatumella sp. JGM100]
MNKSRQQFLLRWLKQQRHYGGRWLRLSVISGVFSAVLIIVQAGLLALLLENFILKQQIPVNTLPLLLVLAGCFVLRALLHYFRELFGFRAGMAIRQAIRQQIIDRLESCGPVWVKTRPTGSWTTLLQEQIENMQDYYARYLPQMSLAALIPLMILIVLAPVNWAAALILFCTAPLIPLFMAMVGMGAAEANRRNFHALARLSGDFLDRLRGLDTLRLFHRGQAEQQAIADSSEQFRQRTMEVLRMAFLSSAVLEFFAAISIAVVAVYFGFSYLGVLHFGDYHRGVTLFAGFLVLILAPEFFQPLRDLGNFYHAKAQAVGAADVLEAFLRQSPQESTATESLRPQWQGAVALVATNMVVTTASGQPLTEPLNFTLAAGKRVALLGTSGAGKTSLMNALLGFLPYTGSLTINGSELRDTDTEYWQKNIAWVGQNPVLPETTLRENITFGRACDDKQFQQALHSAGIHDFIRQLPQGAETAIGDNASGLSVGQAQRIAVARALLLPASLMLLDEPAASLDSRSEQQVMRALQQASLQQTTLMITHQPQGLQDWDEIWVMGRGQIIQRGRWQELAATPGAFRDMVQHRSKELQS